MKHSSSRILTTHVGSLVRPPEVVDVLSRKPDGAPFSADQLAVIRRHVAQAVQMQADCGIEAANPRHEHEYHVWEDIKFPEGKIIIPGVVAHTTNCVEHPELVAERLTRYAKIVGRENVIAGVDCGFAQRLSTSRVHSDIMWEKFRMLSQGAKLASRRLWN